MAINNILDMIGEGIRESNPIYRAKQKNSRNNKLVWRRLPSNSCFNLNRTQLIEPPPQRMKPRTWITRRRTCGS